MYLRLIAPAVTSRLQFTDHQGSFIAMPSGFSMAKTLSHDDGRFYFTHTAHPHTRALPLASKPHSSTSLFLCIAVSKKWSMHLHLSDSAFCLVRCHNPPRARMQLITSLPGRYPRIRHRLKLYTPDPPAAISNYRQVQGSWGSAARRRIHCRPKC